MKINKKRSFISLSLLLVLIISCSAVSASNDNLNQDINDISMSSDLISQDTISVSSNNETQENLVLNENSIKNELKSSISVDGNTFTDIQNSIDSAEEGDTIELSEEYTGSSQIIVNKSVTIKGTEEIATLDAESTGRIFNITADNVVLSNLKLVNGKVRSGTPNGGAIIWSGGNGTIENSEFENNAVITDLATGNGGAIYWTGDNGKITNTTFTSNKAPWGGSIRWEGDNGYLSNCTFKDSIQSFTASGYFALLIKNVGYYGAAVAWFGESGNIENCNFINNSIVSQLDNDTSWGILYANATSTTIKNNIFLNNSINSHTILGEVICIKGENAKVNYNIFSNNQAEATDETTNISQIYLTEESDIDYNYWGTNNPLESDIPISNLENPNNWLILNVTVNSEAKINEKTNLTISLNQYTNSKEEINTIDEILPAVEAEISCENGSFEENSKSISTIIESIQNIEYTVPETGNDTITVRLLEGEFTFNITIETTVEKDSSNLSIVNESEDEIIVALTDSEGSFDGSLNVIISLNDANETDETEISETNYTTTNGTITITISDLENGDYTISINFNGDEDHNATSLEKNITINKTTIVDTITNINVDSTNITVNSSVIITPTVTANGQTISGNVELLINGETETEVEIGSSYTFTPSEEGTYTVSAVFKATEEYSESNSESISITVNPISSENTNTTNETDTNTTNTTDTNTTDTNTTDTNTTDTNTTNGTDTNTTDSNSTDLTKTFQDLQNLIDNAESGATIDLGNYSYENISNINITKDITLVGNNTQISSYGDGTPIFNIPPNLSNVTISGIEFLVNNADIIVKAIAENGTSPTSIITPNIEISDNTFKKANDDVVGESVNILVLESERGILAPSNEISIANNTIDNDINPFKFEVSGILNASDAIIPIGGNIPETKATVLVYKDMNTTAIDTTIDGRNGEYFVVKLTDSDGNPLANKFIQIGFNANVYNRTTDENGSAKLQINLKNKGTYTFAICFLGDDNYNASFAVSKITVALQKAKLTTSNKSYKASAKTKTLTATFKSSRGNLISGQKVTFTVNGKSYSATTNSKGVATVKVSLSTKKTYTFTAKTAATTRYVATSVSGKVTIK